jgi:hypothetical protein
MAESTQTAKPYRVHNWVLFAAQAPVAVVMRRGPKRKWRLIHWDLATDTFTLGQWMGGQIFLCDLSPFGTHLLYHAIQYRALLRYRYRKSPMPAFARPYDPLNTISLPDRKIRSHRKTPRYQRLAAGRLEPSDFTQGWTAISRPPYFSALAVWPTRGFGRRGAVFLSPRAVGCFQSADTFELVENVPRPVDFRIRSVPAEYHSLPSALKPAYSARDPDNAEAWAAVEAAGAVDIDWATAHASPDLLFSADGCIFRVRNWRALSPNRLLASASLLYDLRPMAFESIPPPPEALRW